MMHVKLAGVKRAGTVVPLAELKQNGAELGTQTRHAQKIGKSRGSLCM